MLKCDIRRYFPSTDHDILKRLLARVVECRRGLPLRNQTSRFFANVYLDPLDQMVNRELRPGSFVRYVDDFLLFADTKEELATMRSRIERCLAGLRVRVHERKSRVYRCADGPDTPAWYAPTSSAFAAALRKCTHRSARAKSAGSRSGQEFTRGLAMRSIATPGSCASSCSASSRS
ncbi:MAG: RNA-directed DNA polymerase [bacterium]|nr:RNA-directed DNA polymerase [bacterium]